MNWTFCVCHYPEIACLITLITLPSEWLLLLYSRRKTLCFGNGQTEANSAVHLSITAQYSVSSQLKPITTVFPTPHRHGENSIVLQTKPLIAR